MASTFPDVDTRTDAVAAWLGLFLEPALDGGAVDVVERAGDVVAVAAWRLPDAQTAMSGPPSIAGLLTALVGADHARAVGSGLAALRPHAPAEPSAYVQFLAVDPVHQHQGLGGVVLQPGLDRADAAGLGVHLETANPRAVPFYRARGFVIVAEVDLASEGPHLWVLAQGRTATASTSTSWSG